MLKCRLRLLSQLRGPYVWALQFPLNIPATEGAAVTCLTSSEFPGDSLLIQEPILMLCWRWLDRLLPQADSVKGRFRFRFDQLLTWTASLSLVRPPRSTHSRKATSLNRRDFSPTFTLGMR